MPINLFSSGIFSKKKSIYWENDLKIAKKHSNSKNLAILLFFRIPDHNTSYHNIDKSIFNTDEFVSYATENLIMVRADFPSKKKNALSDMQQAKNDLLADIYNHRGIFPYAVILDSNGVALGKIAYLQTSVGEIIERIESYIKRDNSKILANFRFSN